MRYLSFLRRPQSGATERLTVGGGTRAFEIAVIRHPRARRYTLRVRDAARDIVLTMPRRGSLREARAFAEKNVPWIAARVAKLPEPVPFVDGAVFPIRGEPHRIVHLPDARGTVWIERDADGSALICVAGAREHIARRVGDFLKREAKSALTDASRNYARALGVSIRRIGLRDSTTRWGSCSETGSLSYSWRLIFAPPFVLGYLAAHEIAHRIELNHSARFWRVLDALNPDRERAEAWLSAHGNGLHRYGAKLRSIAADAEQPVE